MCGYCTWRGPGLSSAFGPTPGIPGLLQSALLSCFCEGHRCLRSSGTLHPQTLSNLPGHEDPLVLVQRSPTRALTLTGAWIEFGAEMD